MNNGSNALPAYLREKGPMVVHLTLYTICIPKLYMHIIYKIMIGGCYIYYSKPIHSRGISSH